MNHPDIVTFLTLAASSSLSEAARKLYISQPALSHRLAALEKEVGTELIVRQKGVRTIELTAAGKRFVPIAKKWEQLFRETQTIQSEQEKDFLRISCVDSLNFYFMPQVIAGFLEENPNCQMEIVTMRSNLAYRAVESREIDAGFVTNPHFFKKAQNIPLFKEKFAFVCGKNAPYQDGMHPGALSSAREIYTPWSNTFLIWHDYWFGTNPNLKVTLDNMALLERLLLLEDSWAVVPATVAKTLLGKGDFCQIQMDEMPEPRTCYAILNDQRRMSQSLENFIHAIGQTANNFPEITVLQMK